MPKKRNTKIRLIAPVLHIYCEGEKTEPNYLEKYIQEKFAGNRTKNVIKIEPTKKNTPIQLVDEAIKKKNGSVTPGDVFWVAYDRESVSKYSDELHDKALQKANKNGINVALSNVCFEVWLLLHFMPNTTPFSSCSNLIDNSSLKDELKKLGLADYDKGNASLYEYVKNGIAKARIRAAKMNSSTLNSAPQGKNKSYQLNPYTDIHLLLDAIDAF